MANIDHILVYGQSLAVGWSSNPPFNPVPEPVVTPAALDAADVLMLNTGARTRAGGDNETALNGATITSFTGLREVAGSFAGGPLSETPCSGIAYWLQPRIDPRKVLITAHGRSGYKIAQLAKGTQPYANGQTIVTRAKAVAAALGHTYNVKALVFLQGESNESAVDSVGYAAALEQLRLDYQNDLRTLLADPTFVLPMFISQFSSFYQMRAANTTGDYRNAGKVWCGLPQMPDILLGAHEDYENIHLVTPNYTLEHVDGTHLVPQAYRWQGEHIGRAIYEHVYAGAPWDCLRPDTVTRNGHIIDISFVGQAGTLVADTALVNDAGNLGFTVTIDGRLARVTTARVVRENVVRLTLATPCRAGAETIVSYGVPQWDCNGKSGPDFGPRGNLRDSAGEASVFGDPNLYRWAAHFSRTAEDVTRGQLLAVNEDLDTLAVNASGDTLRAT